MFKLTVIAAYLTAGAVSDIRRKSVSLVWILVGGIMTILLFAASVLSGREPVYAGLLGAGVALPFLAVSGISPRHFGRADGAAVMMIGLLTGAEKTTAALFIALIISSVCGCAGLISKGKEARQQEMPFLPCLAAGFIGAQLL